MSLLKLFRILMKKNRGAVLLSILLSLVTIMSSVCLFALSSYIISFCALHPSVADIAVAVVGVRFFGISRGGFRYLERLISHNTTFKLLSNLRVWLYEKIELLPVHKYILMDKEDIFTRIVNDIEVLQEFYLRTFIPFIVAAIIGFFGFVFFIFWSKTIAISFLVFYAITIIAVPITIWYCSKGLYKSLVLQKSLFKEQLIEIIENLDELLGNSALVKWREKLENTMLDNERVQERLALWRSISGNLIFLLTNITMIICLVCGITLVNQNKLSGVYLAVIALSSAALFEGTQNIPVILQKIEQSKAAGDRIFEIVECEEENRSNEVYNKSDLADTISWSPLEVNKVELENISFRYPGHKEDMISNVSIKLQRGKRIAIVGESGGGKTTLSYLFINWLKSEKGKAMIDGVSVENLSEEAIMRLFAVVDQRIYLFNTTIKNNLIIANSSASLEEMEKALSVSQIKDFIDSLPEGLSTELGEDGMKLSGGQRQRLGIARALLKNTPFIILDEPTAGIDMETEKKLLRAIYENTQDKGLLIITHRLVEMEEMDEIIVMNKGRIIERGRHEKLMKQEGVYYRMWGNQRNELRIE